MKIKAYQKGMTLIEIIVSIALIAIISICLFTVYTGGMKLSVRAGDKTKNLSAAASIAEDSLAGSPITYDPVAKTATVNGNTMSGTTYTNNPSVPVVVTFNGSTMTRNETIAKINIDKIRNTVNNGTVNTGIEVYKP